MSLHSIVGEMFARVRSWSRALFQRERLEEEMNTELTDHLASLTVDLERAGHSPQDAARRARVLLGATTKHKEEMRASMGLRWWDELRADLRYGIRMLRKSPGFAAIAVSSLALGVGANTAIFTVAKHVLMDTLQVRNPHELRMVTWMSGHNRPVPPVWGDVSSTENGGLTSNSFSYPVLLALRERTDVFRDLLAFKDISMTATIDGSAEVIAAEMLSGNAFSALGVTPVLGRTFTNADDASAGAGPVAVISDAYWAQRFGRSADVLGKAISLNGVAVTIVGVSAGPFAGLQMGTATQMFVPLTMQPMLIPKPQGGSVSLLNNPQSWWVQIMVRLRPDVPEGRAQAALDTALRQAARATLPASADLEQLHLQLLEGDRGLDYIKGQFADPSYVLLALAGLVLLLACVNLANLLLSRAATRQREMSTRLALGAGKARILRQVMTESLLLSAFGGCSGLLLGFLGRDLIPRLLDTGTMPVEFDWRVLLFGLGVSIATGILFGAAPAWQATRTEVSGALKDASKGSAGRQRMWVGKSLVVCQIALSAILLVGAGLFVSTLVHLSHRPLGFQQDHLLLFRLKPPRARYTEEQTVVLYRQLEENLAAIPGVRSVSASNIAIIGDGHSGSTFHVTGKPQDKEEVRVQENGVSLDFFRTMGISILQGRDFATSDTPTSPRVAIVNRALAQQFFPNQNPIGLTFDGDIDDGIGPTEIVGIVSDTRYADLRTATPPTFYLLNEQKLGAGHMVFEIRTAGEPGGVLSQVRAAVVSLDRDLPLIDVRTMREQVESTMLNERIFAQLTSAFGLLALVLACVGIYGIMAYSVASRRSEIGIRMALGAQPAQVRGMILRESSWLAAVGIVVGIGAALLLTRLVKSMLFGVEPWDPATIGAGVLILLLVATAASWIPARRAARLQPMDALRHE